MFKTAALQSIIALALATVLLPNSPRADVNPATPDSGLERLTPSSDQPAAQAVTLNWLDQSTPGTTQGVSWGVPWPNGAMKKETTFQLADAKGNKIPVQSWPLAYWPDGTLKWTGHAISSNSKIAGPLTIQPGQPAAPQTPLDIRQTADAIEIVNGTKTWRIANKGQFLVDSIVHNKQTVAQQGRLVCLREDRSELKTKRTIREESFTSKITAVTLEQSGSIRAVVKLEGKHQADSSDRAWLPFTVRLYFFAGVDSVKMVHTFIFDGDQEKDFIRGLGVRFSVPMRQQSYNRHIRLAGETGMFAEPIQPIAGRRSPGADLYAQQIAGKQLNLDKQAGKGNIAEMAKWDDFKLSQGSADSFTILKRTGDHSSWITAIGGKRSLGLAFVGDTSGGLAVGMRNFWQLHPTGLDIHGMTTKTADLTVWFWSPDGPAMDMRHYDNKGHGLEASYEDYQPGFSNAHGVARTTELTICPFAQVPPNTELWDLTKTDAQPARLVCTPQHYHSIPVFGIWSLPDRSNAGKKWIEDQLERSVAFYQGQIEQRRWYGFWDFGDVMHQYDTTRHTWKYDIGGFAWANSELVPDVWLWYSFLRSGRADIFRMAEAMTRHTQEVDCAHLGKFAGLGSRHNVRHWGDGAKEVRVSQALLKRFLYYLTTDERMGDLMDEVVDVDFRLVEIDPLRMIEPKTKYPTHVRVGPDWFALASNWMARWERTGDVKYRDKIITGMKCMAAMPRKLFSGPSYGYDPKTSMIYQIHNNAAVPTLAALMGGPEFCFEVRTVIDLPEWNAAWLHYCEFLTASAAEQKKAIGATVNGGKGAHYARMPAFAAYVKKDPKLAQRAWQEFLGGMGGKKQMFPSRKIEGPDYPVPVEEGQGISTNDTAQWCLNAIEMLEMIGKDLPANDPRWATK